MSCRTLGSVSMKSATCSTVAITCLLAFGAINNGAYSLCGHKSGVKNMAARSLMDNTRRKETSIPPKTAVSDLADS